MKSVLMSIQPYWGFLIIAEARGWDLNKYNLRKKTVELRKRVPVDKDWDRSILLYFSNDRKSLNRIPEEYRGDVEKLLGKVVCVFNCDKMFDFLPYKMYEGQITLHLDVCEAREDTGLSWQEFCEYLGDSHGYGLHIDKLRMFSEPTELKEFDKACGMNCVLCKFYSSGNRWEPPTCNLEEENMLRRPPQSWCYIMSYWGI